MHPGDTATSSWFPHLQNFLSLPLRNQIRWYLILSNQTEAMIALDINIVLHILDTLQQLHQVGSNY